jgi:hypothetical protein
MFRRWPLPVSSGRSVYCKETTWYYIPKNCHLHTGLPVFRYIKNAFSNTYSLHIKINEKSELVKTWKERVVDCFYNFSQHLNEWTEEDKILERIIVL